MANSTNIDRGIVRAVDNAIGLHFVNAPSHGKMLVDTLAGMLLALSNVTNDDPLLFAYRLMDDIPKVAGLLIQLEKWCTAVIEATPDQIESDGAQRCLD